MVNQSIIDAIRKYINVLNENGINAEKAILFGSYARGDAKELSDIDILVISEDFDRDRWSREDEMWELTLDADSRIQPIPVGVKQFIEDDSSVAIEMARREGIEIKRN